MTYLYGNGMLSERQSGFRPNHRCISALIDVPEELRLRVVKNMIQFLVLLDHSKVFDTVKHIILSQKLKYMCNFSNTADMLISSYLRDRNQFVCHDGNKSNNFLTSRGVPQFLVHCYIQFTAMICQRNWSFAIYKCTQMIFSCTLIACRLILQIV